MNREAKKAAYERGVFETFVKRSGIEVDPSSIRNGSAAHKEPDLVCRLSAGSDVGFELGRIIDPNLAKVVNQREPQNGQFIKTSDPSRGIARKKIKKKYGVPYPVQLLLYKEHPLITPDDVIIPTIRPVCHMKHQYAKVWFMGDDITLLYERS